MYTSTFHVKLISGIESKSPKEISRLFLSYDDRSGFGFIDTETFHDHIQTILVYKTIISQRIFEPYGGRFVSEEQIIYEQASFEIYPSQSILQSYVGGRRLQKIILCLSNVFKQKISFEDVFANIPEILKKLSGRQIEFSIKSFSVSNFRPQVGITGRFYATVSDSRAAKKIIKDYEGDVIDVQLEIANDKPSYWYIAANGKVVVKSPDKDALLSDSDLVKHLVAGK